MPSLSVTASITTADSPEHTFERFAEGRVLDLDCVSLAVGTAVSLSLPVGGDGPAGQPITLLGHIAAVHWGRSVRIVHYQPWSGHVTLRFLPDGGGCRIVIESSLDEDGVAWLAHKRGFAPPEPPRSDRHRIGLLVSKSGPAAVFAQATERLAALAVEEINDEGGIDGKAVELIVGDDASDSGAGAASALRLVRSGCRVIFACVTSASFNSAAAVVGQTDTLLVHSVVNEGGLFRSGLVRLGDRPLDQLRAGVPALMRASGGRRWFFVGHRYSWSYGAHWAARRVVAENDGSVVGDAYQPLGTQDFADTLAAISDSGAELILSTLVGQDEVHFEKQCAAIGLRESTRTLALVLDEATHQLIGPRAARGVWSAFGYFQGAVDGLRDVEDRYRSDTSLAPPMSALSEATYQGIRQYGRVASLDPDAGRNALSALMTEGAVATPRPILLAESRGSNLHVQ